MSGLRIVPFYYPLKFPKEYVVRFAHLVPLLGLQINQPHSLYPPLVLILPLMEMYTFSHSIISAAVANLPPLFPNVSWYCDSSFIFYHSLFLGLKPDLASKARSPISEFSTLVTTTNVALFNHTTAFSTPIRNEITLLKSESFFKSLG